MSYLFLLLLLLHAAIHLLGFLKAFGFKELEGLKLPVSKRMGVVWLVSSVLLLTYGIVHFLGSSFSWGMGLLAVLLSQISIIASWKDAKFGTLPNLLILIVALVSYGEFELKRTVDGELEALLAEVSLADARTVEEKELQALPEPVREWMRSTGIVGKDRIRAAWIDQKASMKMEPGQEGWYEARAVQLSTYRKPAFLWTVRMDMMPLVEVRGRDKFVEGKGKMLIKVNGLIDAVHSQGEKIDQGALQRYLGELVWAPSLALHDAIEWEAIDECSARATMNYRGLEGSGTFHFDEDGDFSKFVAERYRGGGADAEKHPWVLTVQGYSEFEGIRMPSKMKATWELDDGDWTWLKLRIEDIAYDRKAVEKASEDGLFGGS